MACEIRPVWAKIRPMFSRALDIASGSLLLIRKIPEHLIYFYKKYSLLLCNVFKVSPLFSQIQVFLMMVQGFIHVSQLNQGIPNTTV